MATVLKLGVESKEGEAALERFGKKAETAGKQTEGLTGSLGGTNKALGNILAGVGRFTATLGAAAIVTKGVNAAVFGLGLTAKNSTDLVAEHDRHMESLGKTYSSGQLLVKGFAERLQEMYLIITDNKAFQNQIENLQKLKKELAEQAQYEKELREKREAENAAQNQFVKGAKDVVDAVRTELAQREFILDRVRNGVSLEEQRAEILAEEEERGKNNLGFEAARTIAASRLKVIAEEMAKNDAELAQQKKAIDDREKERARELKESRLQAIEDQKQFEKDRHDAIMRHIADEAAIAKQKDDERAARTKNLIQMFAQSVLGGPGAAPGVPGGGEMRQIDQARADQAARRQAFFQRQQQVAGRFGGPEMGPIGLGFGAEVDVVGDARARVRARMIRQRREALDDMGIEGFAPENQAAARRQIARKRAGIGGQVDREIAAGGEDVQQQLAQEVAKGAGALTGANAQQIALFQQALQEMQKLTQEATQNAQKLDAMQAMLNTLVGNNNARRAQAAIRQ